MNSLDYPLCALFIAILLNILFFAKKRIDTTETKIYRRLILCNLLECIFAVIGLLLIINLKNLSFMAILIKIDYCLMLLWGSIFAEYVVSISVLNKKILIFIKEYQMY